MAVVTPPTMTDTPPFPVLADRAAGTYNSKAFAFGTHMSDVFNDELEAVAENVYDNALDAAASATTANDAAADAETAALAAEASAASAVAAPGTAATSTTGLVVGTGSKSLTVQTGKAFSVGQSVVIADTAAPATNWMFGQVTSYSSGTGALVVNATVSAGSGTLAAWTISISANPAAAAAAAIGIGGRSITGNVTLTVAGGVIADAAISVTPTAPGRYVTLPDATTITTEGVTQISVYNAGDFDYGVKDSAGAQLGWVRPRTGAIIGLADNSTPEGVWTPQGLEKTGETVRYATSPTLANMVTSGLRPIALDATRTLYLFGGTDCYAIVLDHSTGLFGSPVAVRTTIASNAYLGIKTATDQVMVVSCNSTTGLEAIILTISGSAVTPETATKDAETLAGNFSQFGQIVATSAGWVFSYGRATTTSAIRAISLSGVTPSIGTEQALVPATVTAAFLFATGAIVRTVAIVSGTSGLSCKPYTQTGNSLAAGTAAAVTTDNVNLRAFLNGNGNIICQYINGNHTVVIFSLSGTTESASFALLHTGVPTSNAITTNTDYVKVSASKVCFLSSEPGTTYVNILTDTAGTASVGTAISFTTSGTLVPMALPSTGNNASFACAESTTYSRRTFDCSGASPVAASFERALTPTNFGPPAASDKYGVKAPGVLIAGINIYSVGSAGVSVFSRNDITVTDFVKRAGSAASVGETGNAAYFNDVWNGTTGYTFSKIEAAA